MLIVHWKKLLLKRINNVLKINNNDDDGGI